MRARTRPARGESSSDLLVPARCDVLLDTATADRFGPAALRSKRPSDRLSSGSVGSAAPCGHSRPSLHVPEQATDPGRMRPDLQRSPTARHCAEDFPRAFAVVRTSCSSWIWPASSSTQYQLLRSPRSNPIVSFCCEIFLVVCVPTVLTFFIAGLLCICALSTSITWERTASCPETGLLIPSVYNSWA